MGVNFTDNEQNSISLMNVSYYDSKADFLVCGSDKKPTEVDAEEFDLYEEDGIIQDITCGTYNGATQSFTPWQLNVNNILDTILNALHEEDFYNTGYYGNCSKEEAEEFKEWTNADWIREYTEVYEVVVIVDRVYVNQD